MKERNLGSVFYISVSIVVLFVLWGFIFPDHLEEQASNALAFTTQAFGWFYLMATFFFLTFAFYLAFGPYGKIKLGADDDEPEYSFLHGLRCSFLLEWELV